MKVYAKRIKMLKQKPKTWLVTGVAGFIGSNILEELLKLDQSVIGLDNFVTGSPKNLDDVKLQISKDQWERFKFREGDIRNLTDCRHACAGVDYVLNQAALGSVPRSIANPIATNESNITGFINMLTAAKDEGVKSFTYASSSSVYGDHMDLPKKESVIGNPLSPYALTKLVNELYSDVYASVYNFKCLGLRYFNVFGRRQDPNGAYAAVIPRWISAMLSNTDIIVNGDGETSRDFCFIDNVVQANILAATHEGLDHSEVFNVACGDRTSLNRLILIIKDALNQSGVNFDGKIVHSDFRAGDVRHSEANIKKSTNILGYLPEISVSEGISRVMPWYLKNSSKL